MRDLTAMLARRIIRQLRRDEHGAIGVLVAVLIGAGVLTGMAALVVDVGQLYQERAEQQNGADAAALGVAKSCVLGLCDPDVAAHYASANASNLTGGVAGVTLVCGSGSGLQSCPASSGALTNCPPAASANYVDVYTTSQTASGSTLLPPVFANTLLGNSSYRGTDVVACSQAVWGAPSSASTVALTISACEWDQATQQGTSFAPPPTYPPDPLPNPASDQVLALNNGGMGAGGCATEPAGADGPGVFSWLAHIRGNCTTTASPPILTGRTRPTSFSCELLLQNAQQNNTPLLVPIYVASNPAATPPTYSLEGFADFVVTGYNLPTSFASDWLDPVNNCQGNTFCLNGYFTQGVIPSTGSLTGTNLGASIIELAG
jgi:Flp pilus assembly protein TadG